MTGEQEQLQEIAKSLREIAANTKPAESPDELAMQEIADLKQMVRNFGMELQMMLDNPPSNGLEMARNMRGLAARMSSFGIPEMFRR